MDQLEDKGLLLKQHLREMEEELERKQARLAHLKTALTQSRRDRERYGRDAEKLDGDVDAALRGGKEDLARMLIRKRRTLDSHIKSLDRGIEDLENEYEDLKKVEEEQRPAYEDLKIRAAEYFRQAERRAWTEAAAIARPDAFADEASDEEIELELLHRKEALGKGGDPS
jgi:phage shock protein A